MPPLCGKTYLRLSAAYGTSRRSVGSLFVTLQGPLCVRTGARPSLILTCWTYVEGAISSASKLSQSEGQSDIQQRTLTQRVLVECEIDRVGEQLGFQSQEAPPCRRKKQEAREPIGQINIRASVIDLDCFVEWCERNRYSYREGFGELVKLIDRA